MRRRNPFRPATVAALLAVGAIAFLLFLYALGAGWTGQQDRNGGAHAASNALNGFTGFVDLLERRGHNVSLSRSPSAFNDESLLVVTPGQFADAEEIARLIEDRSWLGPTIIILPKWAAIDIPDDDRIEAEDGWVVLLDIWSPQWLDEIEPLEGMQIGSGQSGGWTGFGMSGELADGQKVQGIEEQGNTSLLPLVTDSENDILAGYLNRGGFNPQLAGAAGIAFTKQQEAEQVDGLYPLVIVAEPDLLNNYGLADRDRAFLAVTMIEATMDGFDLPVVFDMTMPGLGSSENLLTLAFRPPFLAATLCLLFVGLVIAWRAFRRFGPARAQAPAMAQGKRQLARNGAALIERARRWHLLGEPYAALVAGRIATALHIRETDSAEREAAIDAAMAHREIAGPLFSDRSRALRSAHRPAEIVRAAAALRSIERMLTR